MFKKYNHTLLSKLLSNLPDTARCMSVIPLAACQSYLSHRFAPLYSWACRVSGRRSWRKWSPLASSRRVLRRQLLAGPRVLVSRMVRWCVCVCVCVCVCFRPLGQQIKINTGSVCPLLIIFVLNLIYVYFYLCIFPKLCNFWT